MKILFVTTVSLTINVFFMPHIAMLVQAGNTVDIACNDADLSVDPAFQQMGCRIFGIPFSRSVLTSDNLLAYRKIRSLLQSEHYELVHTHTPNASAITRIAARTHRKNGLCVYYTAHGFHFYHGAPIRNWILFYPLERFCSRFTDTLITINQEDYLFAVKHMKAKRIVLIPGVGVNLERFQSAKADRAAFRRETGIPAEAFVLLSVGELNRNKNHQIILRAIAALPSQAIHYAIAGVGPCAAELQSLAEALGIGNRFHLLGYRKDVEQLYRNADLYLLPSVREGLNVSLMEAMASGLPCVVSNARGNVDLIPDPQFHCRATSAADFAAAIQRLIDHPDRREAAARTNRLVVQAFSTESVLKRLKDLYRQAVETGR